MRHFCGVAVYIVDNVISSAYGVKQFLKGKGPPAGPVKCAPQEPTSTARVEASPVISVCQARRKCWQQHLFASPWASTSQGGPKSHIARESDAAEFRVLVKRTHVESQLLLP